MNWFRQFREIASWAVILAFVVMFISEEMMVGMNPQGYGPWPDLMPRPKSFEFWLWSRNISFLTAVLTGVFSLPRWPSVVGLTLTLVYTVTFYWLFSTY